MMKIMVGKKSKACLPFLKNFENSPTMLNNIQKYEVFNALKKVKKECGHDNFDTRISLTYIQRNITAY